MNHQLKILAQTEHVKTAKNWGTFLKYENWGKSWEQVWRYFKCNFKKCFVVIKHPVCAIYARFKFIFNLIYCIYFWKCKFFCVVNNAWMWGVSKVIFNYLFHYYFWSLKTENFQNPINLTCNVYNGSAVFGVFHTRWWSHRIQGNFTNLGRVFFYLSQDEIDEPCFSSSAVSTTQRIWKWEIRPVNTSKKKRVITLMNLETQP